MSEDTTQGLAVGDAYLTHRRNDCPSCGSKHLLVDFYEVPEVPVHSVLLMSLKQEAISYTRRPLALALCQCCGFVFNRVYDPQSQEYSSRYEETQGFSETFNAFSDRLARDLIARHQLRGKRIMEIGCGKGEFLTHLCDLGECTGIGFDPAYVPTRTRAHSSDRVQFVQDFYSEKHANVAADFVICKMTLEHINETRAFVRIIRRALDDNPRAVVFFQVPDVVRVLEECAFWDIYYEHCSYFSAGSLRRLFENNGFQVLDVWHDFDGQYLMLEALPASGAGSDATGADVDLQHMQRRVNRFADRVGGIIDAWSTLLREARVLGQRVVLWGGGSKAVSFLTTLGVTDEVMCVVDVNPHKRGTFLPGTGHLVVMPDDLPVATPDLVIVMNPIYDDEIRQSLSSLGMSPKIIHITSDFVTHPRATS